MSPVDPIGRDLSRSRAVRRVAGRGCVLCGEGDAELLTTQPAAAILEEHHIAGEANDPDLTVTLCLNCHRKMSARMPGYGVPLDGVQLTRIEHTIGSLRGLAVFSEQLAPALMRWAHQLEQTAIDLDTHDPSWREIEADQHGR